ncbi:MAG: DegT/DnrJ/EryC1/StrS family aminotransferase [Candidatus Adiutrix sp.]|jgi:dTDP-4-amino-4,6-dideoxygalactose transaminase|nr:DegT/DnrJ/EryC1/StrS family aminotransferase [Candidatus Adiutrix sp.]
MEVPILKIPFDSSDVKTICGRLEKMLLEGQLAMGEQVRAFEAEFAAFCGTPLALGCANGTAALELIARGLDLEGASVAVPANTFMATALAPIAAGARVILVDCDPVYFQMCPIDLARKIRPDTRAVFLTHIGGFISPDWRRIRAIAEQNGAAFIEDAAHAHGAETPEGRAGSLGRAGAFSFFPTKVLTTAEGGMVVTADQALYERLLALRQHGQARPGSNIHQSFGLNYRPSEIHALLGLAMMAKADRILAARRRAARLYDELLSGSEISPVLPPPGQKPAYYKYMALLPEKAERAALKTRLREEFRISLPGEVYSLPGHEQPLWRNRPQYLAAPPAPLPVTSMVAARQICLPLYPEITEEAQRYVTESLMRVLREAGS